MVASERTASVAIGHGNQAVRNIDAWPPAARIHQHRQDQHRVLLRCAEEGAAGAGRGAPPVRFRGGGGRAVRIERPVRGGPLHVLRHLRRRVSVRRHQDGAGEHLTQPLQRGAPRVGPARTARPTGTCQHALAGRAVTFHELRRVHPGAAACQLPVPSEYPAPIGLVGRAMRAAPLTALDFAASILAQRCTHSGFVRRTAKWMKDKKSWSPTSG